MNILNQTNSQVDAIPLLTHLDENKVVVIIKSTYNIVDNGFALQFSDKQEEIKVEPEYWGEPGKSSLKLESDIVPVKKSTDIAFVGHAYSNQGEVPFLDVELQVGSLHKIAKVIGNREWKRKGLGYKATEPEPFERMAMNYENAYGGVDLFHSDPSKHKYHEENPVGKGFCICGKKEMLEGLALPNIENPEQMILDWKNTPEPVGFGFVDRAWLQRRQWSGTYDNAWTKNRNPLLPKDFNENFYQAASKGLVTEAYLQGGEIVKAKNLNRSGYLEFQLPKDMYRVEVSIDGIRQEMRPVLDTLCIKPDENKITLTYRSLFDAHWNSAKVDWISVESVA